MLKVGDKVKIIGVNWQKANNYIGKEGVVNRFSFDNDDILIKHIKLKRGETESWFPESSLEKIEPKKKPSPKPPKFKVGDDVEIVGKSISNRVTDIGETYKIKSDEGRYYYTETLDGRFGGYFYPSSLKLVTKKEEPKFKVGDRVAIGKNDDGCPAGTGTVVGFWEDTFINKYDFNCYLVKLDGNNGGMYKDNSFAAHESYTSLINVNPDTFFCCYVDGTGGFAHKHYTEAESMKEAERLAKKERGRKVHVLKCIASCEVPETPVQWNFK
jgi:hypothetical protein